MDIDPKCFFENPPRMKEDLKEFIKYLCEKIVSKILTFCSKLFETERLYSRHIKLAILAMSPDPITVYNRNGLCIQNVKLKPISKILCKSIDNAVSGMTDNKYGNIDKKIFRSCSKLVKDQEMKTNPTAIVAISAIVSQICGILMQSSIENDKELKTLTLESVKQNGVNHRTANGSTIPYSSLIRFISVVQTFEPKDIISEVKSKKKESKTKKLESIEIKPKVSFQNTERPSTPTNCFWEDD